ncbi:MAG: NAD-dependent epimerase/dehydratase family protein, partial [Maribacter sp.]
MNVLITGSSGFLGGYFVDAWNADGHNVISLGRGSENRVICDLKNTFPNIEEDIDYALHIAGKAHSVPKTREEEDEFLQVNVKGTAHLLKGLEPKNIKALLYVSSVAVYGVKYGQDIDENQPLQAVDSYGKSKIEAEEMVVEWGRKNNIMVTILRPPLIIAKKAPGNLGKMINGIKRNRYVNIANGKAKRSVVLAEDIARFSLDIIEVGGIYNVTDGVDVSFKQLSHSISKVLGKQETKNIPYWLARSLAKTGDFFEIMFKKEAPFSTKKLNQMTTDLTF